MKKYIFSILFLIAISGGSSAQLLQKNIFPSLSNQELYDKVISTYKTSATLDYGNARDTLYRNIDAKNDSLECAYTGMKIYLTPGTDPTTTAINGIGGGINAEHSYPQSKGATGIARSDMHHLYPTRVLANSARMSNPLADIPDNVTTKWYKGTIEMSSKPTSDIDQYSESTATAFEPKEKTKGNVARSIFYFYTMYHEQANAADPNFFNIQKQTLCQWHIDDPVDATEWQRTFGIAKYQENKPNPFVLDCSLVSRMYCNNIDQACEQLVSIASNTKDFSTTIPPTLYPNPNIGEFWIVGVDRSASISIYSLDGRLFSNASLLWGRDNWGYVQPSTALTQGIYLCKIDQKSKPSQWIKFVVN